SDSAPADNTDSASFTDYLPEEEKKPFERPEHKETAFITVAAGDGLAEIFRSLGADEVITGGQTMNPSTDDLLNAIDRVNADTIFMLPNNKNIVMAANQAAKMCEDLNIQVIPTRTIPQGITAIINYVPGTDPETARDAMLEEIANVRSAEVTYSVRDTQINGITIKEGDFMSIGDSGILSTGKDLNEVAFEAVSSIADESVELISIYYGSDASEKDAEALLTKCQEAFPGKDIELQFGGQPVYYYILSAE
ncbi:MAG: DAK2 domain-containing protein, partial [Lachnospiraceae bacterium]|nr:DAK2 domain-containing protein [Lachnospiraceae bacterium]